MGEVPVGPGQVRAYGVEDGAGPQGHRVRGTPVPDRTRHLPLAGGAVRIVGNALIL
ncbi:hypothetical protein ACFRMO_32830 [Streptomyces anulatus]|uniref:hypothetical protein n=1 Tax=Streptomyces anulatus TaxID=1892 RepID=UPI0036CBCE76